MMKLLSAGPPSEAQLSYAAQLGINASGMNASQLSNELTKAAIRIGNRALRENSALREGASIQYGNEVFTITAIHRQAPRPSVSLRPFAGGRVKVVPAPAAQWAVTPIKRPRRADGH